MVLVRNIPLGQLCKSIVKCATLSFQGGASFASTNLTDGTTWKTLPESMVWQVLQGTNFFSQLWNLRAGMVWTWWEMQSTKNDY